MSYCFYCPHPLTDHRKLPCRGGIVCGGYVDHDCNTPGCREPEWGVHGDECTGELPVICLPESGDECAVPA